MRATDAGRRAAAPARPLWSALLAAADPVVRGGLLASVILSAVAACLAALAPLALKQLIDGVTAGSPTTTALAAGAAYLVLTGASRLVMSAQTYVFARSDQSLQRRLAHMTFDRLLRVPLPNLLRQSPGSLLQILNDSLHGLRLLVSLTALTLLPVLVQTIVMLAVVATLFDAWTWLIVASAVPAYVGVFTWGANRASHAMQGALDAQIDAGGLFADGLANAETVKNFVAEDMVVRRYDERLGQAERCWRASFGARVEVGLAAAAVFILAMAGILLLGGQAALSGRISVGDFVLLHAYLLQIIAPLESAGFAVRNLGQGASYIRRFRTLLALPLEACPDGPVTRAEAQATQPPAIAFQRVSLAYDDAPAVLHDVTFEIPAGSMVALVGPSGAGKSSILRLILRHMPPSAGDILIDGVPIDRLSPGQVRQRSSCVTSDVGLLNGTLQDNLDIARPDAGQSDRDDALELACANDVVGRLPDGLLTVVGERGARLSTGERQRIAIARAVLRRTGLLLLDEPTSSLDATTEQTILAKLIAATRGRTIVVATHRLALAEQADAVIVLNEGRIVEHGKHADLLRSNGVYAQLWLTQTRAEFAHTSALS